MSVKKCLVVYCDNPGCYASYVASRAVSVRFLLNMLKEKTGWGIEENTQYCPICQNNKIEDKS